MVVTPEGARLDGRVAIVTGAAVGIGEATALALAAHGADLAVCDRDADGLAATAASLSELGARVVAEVLDVRDDEAARAFVGRAAAGLGRLDVLVNNAGGGFAAPFLDVSAKGQDALIRENFTSAATFIRAVVPHLDEGGSIVNVTSIEAHRAGPGYAVYSAMKAALANLTKSLALELGDRGIRVNCVAPDVIPTPGIGPMPVRTPLVRAGHVDDVAAAVVFLAGAHAGFVTGTTLHVDGGNHAAGGWHRLDDGRFAT
ncbi:MAG: SDR family oxidoreductase [Acidimicrobiales bacterium]|nr:SDR family oxidoreductase [Acidimicrobiales bacterium]MCB1015661.1 SDR family oxidoreductase [Acidimicrobiales bacterium]MCB9372147.1 SDR family oxidoreductase [Microthrixaceae bacterium]